MSDEPGQGNGCFAPIYKFAVNFGTILFLLILVGAIGYLISFIV